MRPAVAPTWRPRFKDSRCDCVYRQKLTGRIHRTLVNARTETNETEAFPLVSRSRIGWAFAAMDFRFRRGVSDEHTLQGSVRSEQRSLNRKDTPPGGLRRSGLLASLLLCLPAGRSVTAALRVLLLRRASPEANCGATNAHNIPVRDTNAR